MIGTGTIANVLAIIAGGSLGLLAKGGLKEHCQEGILKALGLATLFIGASGALAGMLAAENGVLSSAGTGKTLAMILALALGALAGEFIDLDMEQLGAWLKAKADRGGDSQFIQGFVTASLTVCIGAMAIVGSIQDLLRPAGGSAPGGGHPLRRAGGPGIQRWGHRQPVFPGKHAHLLRGGQPVLRHQV